MGQQPYAGHTNLEVLQYVRGGGRLPRPSQNCPEELLVQLQFFIKNNFFNIFFLQISIDGEMLESC